MPNSKTPRFTYIDLFAGCGGLSLGLESKGGELLFAIERSPMAAETFMANLISPQISEDEWVSHLQKTSLEQLHSKLLVQDLVKVLGNPAIKSAIKDKIRVQPVDLVVGGPPCQGFSMAGRRNQSDERNLLPHKFLEIVALSNPKFVIMENVLGMNHRFGTQDETDEPVYSQVAKALGKTGGGYKVQKMLLNAKHFGAPQDRPRLFLLGVRLDISRELDFEPSTSIWESQFADLLTENSPFHPVPVVRSKATRTVMDAISDLAGTSKNSSLFLKEMKSSVMWGLHQSRELKNHKPRNHGERAKTKFEIYLMLKKQGLSPLLMRNGLSEAANLRKSHELKKLKRLVYPILDTNGLILAKSAQELKKLLDGHATKKHSQRVLDPSKPCPTVVTSPDDYIHPSLPRVLTVREMARLQGFPDAFEFRGKETTGGLKRRTEVPQYSQVGNAVSPYVGRSLGELIVKLLTYNH